MAKSKSGPVYQLKISLGDIKPPVWRRVEGHGLHLVKAPPDHPDRHGLGRLPPVGLRHWRRTVREDPSGEMEMTSARKVKLSQIVQAGVKKFRYTYDFGDNWDHVIQIEKVLEADPQVKYPRCVKGSRRLPAGGLRRCLGLRRFPRCDPESRPRVARGDAGMGRG